VQHPVLYGIGTHDATQPPNATNSLALWPAFFVTGRIINHCHQTCCCTQHARAAFRGTLIFVRQLGLSTIALMTLSGRSPFVLRLSIYLSIAMLAGGHHCWDQRKRCTCTVRWNISVQMSPHGVLRAAGSSPAESLTFEKHKLAISSIRQPPCSCIGPCSSVLRFLPIAIHPLKTMHGVRLNIYRTSLPSNLTV
jgi:hypothetical protein